MKLLRLVVHHQYIVIILIEIKNEQMFQLEQMLVCMIYNKIYLIKIEQLQQQHGRHDDLLMELVDNRQQILVLKKENQRQLLLYQRSMKNFCKVKFIFLGSIKVNEN